MEDLTDRLQSALQAEETGKSSDIFGSLLEDDSSMVAIDSRATVSQQVDGSRYGVEFYDIWAESDTRKSARVALVYDEERDYQGGWIDYDADVLEPVEWDEEPLRLVVS